MLDFNDLNDFYGFYDLNDFTAINTWNYGIWE